MPRNFKKPKPLVFMGSSAKDLRGFPKEVKRIMGFDIDAIQRGNIPVNAKKLKGMPLVYELSKRFDTDTYRAVYAADIGGVVYILHCFKKKSKQGISTPKPDLDIIRHRLADALLLSGGPANETKN